MSPNKGNTCIALKRPLVEMVVGVYPVYVIVASLDRVFIKE